MLLLRQGERWRSIVMCTSVCLCICLSVREHISGATCAIFATFLRMLPIAVARSSPGSVTKSQAEGVILAVLIIQYARQAQIGIRKILSADDAAYRPGKGVMGVHSAVEV